MGSLVTRVSIDASKTRAKIKRRVGRARGRFEFHSTRRLRSRGARNGHNSCRSSCISLDRPPNGESFRVSDPAISRLLLLRGIVRGAVSRMHNE